MLGALVREDKINSIVETVEKLTSPEAKVRYWEYTIAVWKPVIVGDTPENEFIARRIHFLLGQKAHNRKNSPTGSESQYVLYNNVVYRLSGHWGKCKTCYWPLSTTKGKYHTKTPITLAYCRLIDFMPNSILIKYESILQDSEDYKTIWDCILERFKKRFK